MTRISAILLAGGLSGRMQGQNKLLMPVNGMPMIRAIYQQLQASEVDEVIVVTGRFHKEVADCLDLAPGDQLVYNARFDSGMTSSIQAGVEKATGDAYMICLGDMPVLHAGHYNQLQEAFLNTLQHDGHSILAPALNRKRGNPVIFPKSYREAILTHSEMNGCRQIIRDNINHLCEYITDDPAYISDIDTPEDYSALSS